MFVVMTFVYGGIGGLLLSRGIFTSYAQSENSVKYDTYKSSTNPVQIIVELGKVIFCTCYRFLIIKYLN